MPSFRVRPTPVLLAAVIVGILAAPFLPLPPFALFAAAVLAALTGAFLYRRWGEVSLALLILAFFLFSAGRTRGVTLPTPDDVSRFAGGPSLWVKGSVVSEVERRERGSVFIFAVSEVNDFRAVRPAGGRLRVSVSGATPKTGDVLSLRGRIEEPPTATNPGGFDYRRYLATQGVFSRMKVRETDFHCEGNSASALYRIVRGIRTAIHHGTETLTPRYAGLMNGLVLSDRGGGERFQADAPLKAGLDIDTEEAFLRAGAVHLLSVSGAHMAALALFLTIVFQLLFAPRFVSALVIIALLWLFALASGASAAALRSALMSSVFVAAPLVRRAPDLTNSLIFAALVLLLCAPGDLYNVGFQFSFAALGVFCLYGAPLIRMALRRSPDDSLLFRWTRPLVVGLVGGIVFAFGSEPLAAYYFNRLSPISPVSNLAVIPLAEILTLVGLTSPALAALPAPFLYVASLLANGGVQLLLFLIHAFAALPFASFSVVSPPGWAVIGYYAILGILSPYFRRYAQRKTLFSPTGAPVYTNTLNGMPTR